MVVDSVVSNATLGGEAIFRVVQSTDVSAVDKRRVNQDHGKGPAPIARLQRVWWAWAGPLKSAEERCRADAASDPARSSARGVQGYAGAAGGARPESEVR